MADSMGVVPMTMATIGQLTSSANGIAPGMEIFSSNMRRSITRATGNIAPVK